MKNEKKPEGLLPLRHLIGANAREMRNLERLKIAWPFFVGHGNNQLSFPISIREGLLLVGCHNPSVLGDFRKSAKKNWPALRNRINSLLGLHLRHMEVVPCDPEPVAAPVLSESPSDSIDPLEQVLLHYRNFGRGNFLHKDRQSEHN